MSPHLPFLISGALVAASLWLYRHDRQNRRKARDLTAPLAMAMAVVLGLAFVRDLTTGFPVLPLLVCAVTMGALLLAASRRGLVLLLTIFIWLFSGIGLLWVRADWSHRHITQAEARTQLPSDKIDVAVYTPGDRKYSLVLPILSTSLPTDREETSLRITIPGPDDRVAYEIEDLRVNGQPIELLSDASGSTRRYENLYGSHDHEISMKLRLGAPSEPWTATFQLRTRHAGTTRTRRVTVEATPIERLVLREQRARL